MLVMLLLPTSIQATISSSATVTTNITITSTIISILSIVTSITTTTTTGTTNYDLQLLLITTAGATPVAAPTPPPATAVTPAAATSTTPVATAARATASLTFIVAASRTTCAEHRVAFGVATVFMNEQETSFKSLLSWPHHLSMNPWQ